MRLLILRCLYLFTCTFYIPTFAESFLSSEPKIKVFEVSGSPKIPEYPSLGTSSGGGGGYASPNGTLMDIFEAKYGSKLLLYMPNQNYCYQKYTIPALNKISIIYPEFKMFYDLAFKDKLWFVQNAPITERATKEINISYFDKNKLQAAAFQNSEIIKISNLWLTEKMNSSKESQCLEVAGIFVHETFMQMALKYNLNHDNVRDMMRLVLSEYLGGHLPTSKDEFRRILNSYNFLKPFEQAFSISTQFIQPQSPNKNSLTGQLFKKEVLNSQNVRLSLCEFTKIILSENSLDVIIHNCQVIGREQGYNSNEVAKYLQAKEFSGYFTASVSVAVGTALGYISSKVFKISIPNHHPERLMGFVGGALGYTAHSGYKFVAGSKIAFYENLLSFKKAEEKSNYIFVNMELAEMKLNIQKILLTVESGSL